MSAGKIIGYIFAAITIFFGVIFVWGAFGSEGQPVWLIIGGISVLIGFGLIWFLGRKKSGEQEQEVKLQIDLSGDINLDTLSCQSCGGQLSPENISMLAGAPVVSCPFCGTSYQLTEEPKW
jgi:LPXTG-motif cell wall-anchored protein